MVKTHDNENGRKHMEEVLKSLPGVSITDYDVPKIIKSCFQFDYERFDEPKLRILRERYNMDRVVEKARTEFRKMVLLREWVKSQWWHGTPTKQGNKPDALHILKRAKKGEQFFCDHYSVTFVQCALSLGWNARRINVHTSGYNGHTIAEIWSDQYSKWIIMDTDLNIHYERDGIPLNALELHKVWINEGETGIKEINIREGNPRPRSDIEMLRAPWKLVDYYYQFVINLGNNFFSKLKKGEILEWGELPPGAWWFDENTMIKKGARHITDKEGDLYWTLNQTKLDFKAQKKDSLRVNLTTATPNFDKFLVKIDDGAWKEEEDSFLWNLHSELNKIEVKAVNKFGVEGIPSRVCLEKRRG
jgi:hypothetical protein